MIQQIIKLSLLFGAVSIFKKMFMLNLSSMPTRWNKRRASGPRVVPTGKQQTIDNMDITITVRLLEDIVGRLQQHTT